MNTGMYSLCVEHPEHRIITLYSGGLGFAQINLLEPLVAGAPGPRREPGTFPSGEKSPYHYSMSESKHLKAFGGFSANKRKDE
jgi:hypothetical protein